MTPSDMATIFESHRALLQGLSYRMLGSIAEAEDVVQETFLRWLNADHDAIDAPRAWLVRVCSRLAIDQLKSARVRREQYVGPWLPEPMITSDDTPADQLQLDDTISMALLTVLERLTPAERAAFLLHDVFSFDFEEVGRIIDKSAAACRKLASRAREHVRDNKPRFTSVTSEHERLTGAFLQAVHSGDLEQLQSIFQEDVTFHSDGGGKAQAARKVLYGREAVCRFLMAINDRAAKQTAVITHDTRWFNGAPGLIIYEDDTPTVAFSFAISDGKIHAVYALRNPDKLAGFEH